MSAAQMRQDGDGFTAQSDCAPVVTQLPCTVMCSQDPEIGALRRFLSPVKHRSSASRLFGIAIRVKDQCEQNVSVNLLK